MLRALKFHPRFRRFAGWLMTALLTLCIAPSALAQFQSNATYGLPDGTYSEPEQIVTADFNGDGHPDLAVLDWLFGGVTIFLGNGDGTFNRKFEIDVGNVTGIYTSTYSSMAVGDFNGDGIPDIVVVSDSGPITIFLGNGDGTFDALTPFTFSTSGLGMHVPAVAVGDFNHDGKLDIAVAGTAPLPGSFLYTTGEVLVFLGNGDGTFQAPATYTAGSAPNATPDAIVVGDFNGDGNLDIVTANSYFPVNGSGASMSVLLGNGDGTFQPAVTSAINFSAIFPTSMVAADYNGDKHLDFALADQFGSVAVFFGNGDGTFAPPASYAVAGGLGIPAGIATGDFWGNGNRDLAVSIDNPTPASTVGNLIVVLQNDGTGTFNAAGTFPTGNNPAGLAAADFNGDGKADLAVANFSDGTMEVFLTGPGSSGSGGSGGSGSSGSSGGSSGTSGSGSGGSTGNGSSGGSGSAGGTGSGTCSCTLTGDYVNPAPAVVPTATPVTDSTETSPHGIYTANFAWVASGVSLSVTNSTGATVFGPQTLPTLNLFDFSPDDDRFVYNYTDFMGNEEVWVYDLKNPSNSPIVYISQATSEVSLAFSPSGRYFLFTALVNASNTTLQIYRVQGVTSQDLVYSTQFNFEGLADSDQYGGVDWGFGPGSPETSFVYAYGTGQTSLQWTLVNLAAGQAIASVGLNNIADYWQFNPCGNVAALISQTSGTQVEVDLYNTSTGHALNGSGANYNFPITLESTASGEEIEYSGQTTLITPSICGQSNTSTGSKKEVTPMDSGSSTSPVQLVFSNVTQSGQTTVTISSTAPTPPAPTDFQLGNPATYYDVSTTAVFSGIVTVCINYGGVTFINPSQIQLFHYANGAWVNITTSVNTTTQTVCGSTTSLSPFALFEPSSPLPQSVVASLGTPQQATINATFATPLQVTVTDTNGNAMPAIVVTFAAPMAGPTGIFTGMGALATATTGSNGVAIAPAFTADGFAGSYTVTASVTGVSNPANFSLTNGPATPKIAWTPATPITYGTPLGASELDATTSVPGNFVYNPPAGTTLAAGTQTLSATFTPTDTTDYTTATANATLTVNPAPLTITASSSSMIYGGPPFVVGPIYSGFVNGDTYASLTQQPVCMPVFTNVTPAGSYVTSCSAAVDPNYAISYATGSVSVAQASTSTLLASSSPSSDLAGQPLTFTATVTDSTPGSTGTPTGSVQFTYSGVGAIASAVPLLSGVATFTYAPVWPGTVTAVYSGDNNFTASTSNGVAQTVTPAPIASITPLEIPFSAQAVYTTSQPQQVTISNIGTAPLDLSRIRITGPARDDFSMSINCPESLPGLPSASATPSSCIVYATFSPDDTGVRTAALSITDNDPSNSPQLVGLTGLAQSVVNSDFNRAKIAAGDYIWFNAQFVVRGPVGSDLTPDPVQIFFTNSTVTFKSNGVSYNLPAPDAVVVFSPTATAATTTYDTVNGRWVTIVPSINPTKKGSVYTVDTRTFLTGFAFPVPAGGLPGDVRPVTWSGSFASDTPGVSVQWRWEAGVYTQFSTDYNALGVKPVEDDHETIPPAWWTMDPAGTPENYKQYWVPGASADPRDRYTGDASMVARVSPAVAPLTLSATELNFGSSQVGATSTTSPMTVTVANNGAIPLTISGITVTGTDASDFVIQSNTCAGLPALPPLSSTAPPPNVCTLGIIFTPGDVGTRSGVLAITSGPDGNTQSTQTVDLGGNGTP